MSSTIKRELLQAIKDIQAELKWQRNCVLQQMNDMSTNKGSIEYELSIIDKKMDRASEYLIEEIQPYRCPRCWILNRKDAWLTSLPGDQKIDMFTCEYGHSVAIQFR